MLVADLPRRQRFGEALLIEVRVSARPRHWPYVDNDFNAGLPQEIDKFHDRPGRVAYGEKGIRVIAPMDEGAWWSTSPLILSADFQNQKRELLENLTIFEEPIGGAAVCNAHAAQVDLNSVWELPLQFFGGIDPNDHA